MIDYKAKTYDVVILTHAPNDDLCLALESLITQSIKPTKIVIYNTDESRFYENISDKERLNLLIERKNVTLRHITEKEFDHGATRNKASMECKSNYILFMTDDAIPYDSELCKTLMYAFDEKVAVTYARQIPKENARLKERYVREYNYQDIDVLKELSSEKLLGIKNYFCSNVCAMYDREIFVKLGRFEENIILNEDTFYVYNAIQEGYKVLYKASAKVYHSHNLSHKEQFRRNFDIGVSQSLRKDIFMKVPSEGEGKRLYRFVISKLLKDKKFFEAFDFTVECFYRYIGYKEGQHFKSLSLSDCIKFSTNKNYFRKMNNDFRNI